VPITPVGKQPVRVARSEDAGVILNRDQVNPVFYGRDANEATQSVASVLDPGASITTAAGGSEVWVVALTNNVDVDFIPNGGQWTPSVLNATVAGSVNILGTPSVNVANTPNVNASISGVANVNINSQSAALDVSAQTVNIDPANGFIPAGLIAQLANTGVTNISAGNLGVNVSGGIVNVTNYLSYDLVFTAFCNSQSTAGAPMTGQILLVWYADAGGTIPIYQERYYTWLGNSLANTTPVFGTGGMHGPYMAVFVSNPVGSVAYTMQQFVLWGTGRTAANNSEWRQAPPGQISSGGFSQMLRAGTQSAQGDDHFLATIITIPLAASSSFWQPLPLCPGLIWARMQTSVALNNNFVLCAAVNFTNGLIVAGGGCPGTLWNPGNTAATEFSSQVIAPRAPLFIVAKTTATPTTFSFAAFSQGVV